MAERDQADEQPQPDGSFKVKEIDDDVEGHRMHGALTDQPGPDQGSRFPEPNVDDSTAGPEEAARHF